MARLGIGARGCVAEYRLKHPADSFLSGSGRIAIQRPSRQRNGNDSRPSCDASESSLELDYSRATGRRIKYRWRFERVDDVSIDVDVNGASPKVEGLQLLHRREMDDARGCERLAFKWVEISSVT
jgi:hypothetical protein